MVPTYTVLFEARIGKFWLKCTLKVGSFCVECINVKKRVMLTAFPLVNSRQLQIGP